MPTYKFNVAMTCGGCSGAVERILKKKLPDATYDINLEAKTVDVTVEGPTQEEVQAIIAKCGKQTTVRN